MVRLAERYSSRGVVGVDLAGDELLPMDPRFIEGFKEAKRLGLHVTVHAAEAGPAANVQFVSYPCGMVCLECYSVTHFSQAIEVLGAERIGHGYLVVDDEEVYRMAKQAGVHFEVGNHECRTIRKPSPRTGYCCQNRSRGTCFGRDHFSHDMQINPLQTRPLNRCVPLQVASSRQLR